MESRDTRDLMRRIDSSWQRYLDELFELLRIPSVSTDAAYASEVDRCSRFLVETMERIGLTAERVTGLGHPLVVGERWVSDDKPTLLFYGHYDVQPADPLSAWTSPPFEPTIIDGRLVARGASDDKGQLFAQLKAVEAVLEERGELPVNVKFVIEGEEECGGAAIERFVRGDGAQRLACDCIVISDTAMLAPGRPALSYGLRGVAYFEVTARVADRDLHSGRYGGAIANPLVALAELVAGLYDQASGRVLVPGFYDSVRPLATWELAEMEEISFDEEAFRTGVGATALSGEPDRSVLERLWARPAFDVHGFTGGYQGEGSKTVIPAAATAKLSVRLVPDQDPDAVVAAIGAHIERTSPRGVSLETRCLFRSSPVRVDPQGPWATQAMAALEETWRARPLRVRQGGSIPIVATFHEVFQVPILLVGFGLPDDGIHAPNEKLDVDCFVNGVRTIARFLDRVGGLRPAR